MVYNGYYKVMSNISKMGQLPTPGKRLGRKMNRKGLQRLKYVDVFVEDLSTEHGSNNLPISAPRTQACIVVTCSSVLMILSRPTSYLENSFLRAPFCFMASISSVNPATDQATAYHGVVQLYHFELEWLSHVILKYYIIAAIAIWERERERDPIHHLGGS